MAEFAEDPDCMTPYIRILKTENKYLRHDLERQMTIANEQVNEVERLLNLLRDCNTESMSWLDARDAALDQSK